MKYPKKVLAKAKALYMDYQSLNEIEKQTGMNINSVKYHVREYWKRERDLNRAELFDLVTQTKKANFLAITDSTVRVMTRALQNLATRVEPPTIQEATKAAEILSTLDKITRLDEGKPTDIYDEKPVSVIELQKKLQLDPFYKEIDDANYEEIDEDASISECPSDDPSSDG